jgi:hypothetical protein
MASITAGGISEFPRPLARTKTSRLRYSVGLGTTDFVTVCSELVEIAGDPRRSGNFSLPFPSSKRAAIRSRGLLYRGPTLEPPPAYRRSIRHQAERIERRRRRRKELSSCRGHRRSPGLRPCIESASAARRRFCPNFPTKNRGAAHACHPAHLHYFYSSQIHAILNTHHLITSVF